ncbi:class II fructose-bisphosphate aldolase family protein [Patescibacteria group bacterium]|nr:class II fructose-bisphosphate aldolase family protein [Patescibacteria group bacterium]
MAIGHFNISNLEGFHGIYNAAKNLSAFGGLNMPVIIGLSEGEENFVGREEAVSLICTIRERDNYPIFLNADHHASFESVKKCIDAGFDSVIIDGAKLDFNENVRITKQCVDYAKSVSSTTLVEAEFGYIGSGSNIKETVPEGAGILTKPEEAKKFVELTGIDMLAPSVGSIHGLVKSGQPHINDGLVAEIKKITGIPLVLHGGSGLRDEDFTKAIEAGISIIHISTEIRLVYDEALKKSLADNPNETTPYKILQPAVEAIEKVVFERLKLFNGMKY